MDVPISKLTHDKQKLVIVEMLYSSVSQPLGRSLVRGPGIIYTGPREVLLEFVILVF